MRRALAVATVAAVAVAQLAAQEIKRVGKGYNVVLHPGRLPAELAERFADAAMAAAEAGRVVVDKLYQRPSKVQTVHVWADPAGYSQVAKTPGYPFEMPAVARPETAEAHVNLVPLLTPSEFEVVGFPAGVRHAIIEQVAVLAALERSEAARRDPWSAGVFAAGVLAAAEFAGKADGADPARDDRFWFLVEDAKIGRLENLQKLVLRIGKPADSSQHAWVRGSQAAMAELLAETGNAWARKLLGAQPKAANRLTSQRADALEAVLGRDWLRNDERMRKRLASATPTWSSVSPSASVRDGALLLAGAEQWASVTAFDPPPAGAYTLRGSIEIVPSKVDAAAIMLDRTTESSVLLEFGVGKVTGSIHSGDGDRRDVQEYRAAIKAGVPFTFQIDVSDQIAVTIDGQSVARMKPTGRTMHGRWALLRYGGLAWFRDVRCEATKQAR